MNFLLENVLNGVALSIGIIKDIHEHLTVRLQHDSGQFKKNANAIIGADFETARPDQVTELIAQLVDNLDFRIKNSRSENETVEAILEAHVQFERIHPIHFLMEMGVQEE